MENRSGLERRSDSDRRKSNGKNHEGTEWRTVPERRSSRDRRQSS